MNPSARERACSSSLRFLVSLSLIRHSTSSYEPLLTSFSSRRWHSVPNLSLALSSLMSGSTSRLLVKTASPEPPLSSRSPSEPVTLTRLALEAKSVKDFATGSNRISCSGAFRRRVPEISSTVTSGHVQVIDEGSKPMMSEYHEKTSALLRVPSVFTS